MNGVEFHRVLEDSPLAARAMSPELHENLLRVTVHRYQDLLKEQKDNPALESDLAEVLVSLAEIEDLFGQTTKAVNLTRKSLKWRKRALSHHPDRRAILLEFADTEFRLGKLLTEKEEFGQAEEHLQRALAFHRDLNKPERVADDLHQLATLAKKLHRLNAALDYQRQAVAIWEMIATSSSEPLPLESRFARAKCQYKLAQIENCTGNEPRALERCDQAIQEFRSLAALTENPEALHGVAISLHLRGAIHSSSGRNSLALSSYNLAAAELDRLIRRYPNVVTYQEAQAANDFNLARVHAERGEPTEALKWLTEARQIYEGLIKNHPDESPYLTELGRVHYESFQVHREINRFAEAQKHLEDAKSALLACDSKSIRHQRCYQKVISADRNLSDKIAISN